jgi:hypothetical protein
MISHILAKIYEIILDKKISIWLEIQGKRDKGHVGFRNHHSTYMPRIIMEARKTEGSS